MIDKLLKQSSHYFSGQLMSMLPRFVSFPILTRALSKGEYDTISLIMVTLTLAAAVGKLGLQHSAIRYYSAYRKEEGGRLRAYYATLFYAPLAFGSILAVVLAGALGSGLVPESLVGKGALGLFLFMCFLIPLRCGVEICMQFLRAEQRTKAYNGIMVLSKYLVLALSVFFLFFVVKGLYGFLFGTLLANVVILVVLWVTVKRTEPLRIRCFSLSVLKECTLYGLPMVFVELGHTILSIGDRYLIQYYVGAAALGVYAAGYNLCGYVGEGIILPFRAASTPLYLDLWERKGEDETKEFLSRSLSYLLLLLLPVGFGFASVGGDLIRFVASEKFAEAEAIVPWVMAGVVIYGTRIILDAPIYIFKRTGMVLVLMMVSCFVNILLNIALIPKMGIEGAAIATLAANAVHILLVLVVSFRLMRFPIEYGRILTYTGISYVMYLSVLSLEGGPFGGLPARIATGTLIYAALVMLLEPRVRNAVTAAWETRRQGGGRS